jgi:hypothetical protein
MRRMKGFLQKVWHDPVGSKVIAGVILGCLGAVWLWSKSNFSRNLAGAWAGATSALAAAEHWFITPAVTPLFLLLLILSAAVARVALRQWRQARVLHTGRADITEGNDDVRATGIQIGPNHGDMLKFLYARYPNSQSVGTCSVNLGIDYGGTERLCEHLHDMRLVDYSRSPGTVGGSVALSRKGRNYCIDSKLVQKSSFK